MQRNFKSDHCLNCKHPLKEEDNFCPNCGQENKPTKIYFKHLLLDFFGDYFTFDSKLIRSLKPLLFQPGKMTKEYLNGKRVSFIPPLRMFIFLSIIFLLILSYDPIIQNFGTDSGEIVDALAEEPVPAAADTIATDTIKSEKDSVDDVLNKRLEILSDTSLVKGSKFAVTLDEEYSISRFKELADKYPPEVVADSLNDDGGNFTKLIIKQSVKIYKGEGRDLVRFIMGNGTLILLMLIPIFALILKLLYVRRNEYYSTHFIFSLHFHSFALILLIILQVLHLIFEIYPSWVLYIVLPVYALIALRKVYEQSWGKSILKEILLAFTYVLIILPIVFITTLFVSFLIF